jgi:hypothetical protein
MLTQIIANSPATRFATALDKAFDPRKPLPLRALNLLTGARVTDVDTDKARAVEMRKMVEDILRGQPGVAPYTNFYVDPREAASLSPESVQNMRLLRSLQEGARRHAVAAR